MQALCLDVENGVGIDGDTLVGCKPCGKLLLLLLLDRVDPGQNFRILAVCEELLQLVCILDPALADLSADEGREFRIAHPDPSAERDAVCLVVELLRIDLIERRQLRVL